MAKQSVSSALANWVAHAAASVPLPLTPKNPVFLVGCARSGTSILKTVIASHEDMVAFPGEANHLWHPTGYPWIESDYSKPPLWADPQKFTRLSLADWDPNQARRIQREFAAFQRLRGKRVFLNKSAMIAFMLRDVRKHFPEARFIHIIRDGRSVALSYARMEREKMEASPDAYRTHGHWFAFDDLLDHMAMIWQLHLEEIDRVVEEQCWRDQGIYFECTYEDFCRRPRVLAEQVSDFLGLDPARLRFRDEAGIRDMNYKLSRELSAERIEALTEVMLGELNRKGYPINSASTGEA